MGQIYSFAEAQKKRKRATELDRFEKAMTHVPEKDRALMLNLADEYGFDAVVTVIESQYRGVVH